MQSSLLSKRCARCNGGNAPFGYCLPAAPVPKNTPKPPGLIAWLCHDHKKELEAKYPHLSDQMAALQSLLLKRNNAAKPES